MFHFGLRTCSLIGFSRNKMKIAARKQKYQLLLNHKYNFKLFTPKSNQIH